MAINVMAMVEVKSIEGAGIESYCSQDTQTEGVPKTEVVITVPDSLVEPVVLTVICSPGPALATMEKLSYRPSKKLLMWKTKRSMKVCYNGTN